MSAVCRLCGLHVTDIADAGAYLARVNEKGVPGIWECRPACPGTSFEVSNVTPKCEATPNCCVVVLVAENSQQCDLCGKIAELRPYGPNGECVCFDCGMKDEAAAQRAFAKRFTKAPGDSV